MRNTQNKDSGQAIILIAVAFIALIALAGLAIDGGRVYADRRHAQNASDAGSLAGGGAAALILENANINHLNFKCDNPTNSEEAAVVAAVASAEAAALQAAVDSMEENGYTESDYSVSTKCFEGNVSFQHFIDITTTITKETTAAFIQVVYDGQLINLVDATTEIKPRHPHAYGNAIVALNPEGSCTNASTGGLKFGGTGEVHVKGGGAWSDGCLVTQGNCNVTVEGSGISYVGGQFGGCPVIHPSPHPVIETLDVNSYILQSPKCTDADRVSNIRVHNNQVVDLNPDYPEPTDTSPPSVPSKLICLTDSGDAIRMTGGTLIGHGVTIYLEGGGDVTINGGVVQLSGPIEDDDNEAIPGVILYASGDSNINMEGNHESTYTGLIYSPEANIKITGEGDIGPTLNTQIIGYNVTLLGTASIDINFNNTWVHTYPTSLDLIE